MPPSSPVIWKDFLAEEIPANTLHFLLRQIVNLQPNRASAGTFNCINHLDDIAVVQGAGRLYEHGLLNLLIFRHGGCFHSDLVGMLRLTLLESLRQLGRHGTGMVHRTHWV